VLVADPPEILTLEPAEAVWKGAVGHA